MLKDFYWLFISMCFLGPSGRQFCVPLTHSCYLSSTFKQLKKKINLFVVWTWLYKMAEVGHQTPKLYQRQGPRCSGPESFSENSWGKAIQFKACWLPVTHSQKVRGRGKGGGRTPRLPVRTMERESHLWRTFPLHCTQVIWKCNVI